MDVLFARAWMYLQSLFGLTIVYLGTLSDYGRDLISQAQAMWDVVFAIELPGSTSTVGDWMVISGVSYFLTIVCTALLIKVVWLATKASFGFVQSLAP